MAKPLHDLTKKEENFVWTKERGNAFINITKCLVTIPIQGYLDAKEPFILDIDARKSRSRVCGPGGTSFIRKMFVYCTCGK